MKVLIKMKIENLKVSDRQIKEIKTFLYEYLGEVSRDNITIEVDEK